MFATPLRYTVLILSKLGDGEKVADHVILNWVNTTLSQKNKDTQISSFKVCVCFNVCVSMCTVGHKMFPSSCRTNRSAPVFP